MRKVQGVILDVDGTLIDSNDAHTQAWLEAMKESGFNTEFEKVRKFIGMGADNLLPLTTGQMKDNPQGKQMSERQGQIFEEKYLPQLKAFPGAKELIQRMHGSGLKLVVGSSANADLLDKLLGIVGIKHLIAAQTSMDDAKHSKPNPDIVEVALKKIGLQAYEVVMLGDTPYDIEAASKVQVSTIALCCGGWTVSELGGAIAHYDDPADLLAHYTESPLMVGIAETARG